MKKTRIGVLGCGFISDIYLKNLTQVFRNVEVVAVADLDMERAKQRAETYHIPRALSAEELYDDPEIELVLNLTNPKFHYETCRRALLAGKHVYVEKPLALHASEGRELADLAAERGLLLGGAPDTFLGASVQTARKLLDDGYIGRPVGATTFMLCHGHESWHPAPDFYYQQGGGPLFDMGPYYLTALVYLLGGVEAVCGLSSKSFPTRTIESGPRIGERVDVEVDTHVTGVLQFESGITATMITSFDVWDSTLPFLEIYGTLGTLIVPDPDRFGGTVRLATTDGKGFSDMPNPFGYAENSRGIGVSDMADCIQNGGAPRASVNMTLHVLEIMEAIQRSSDEHRYQRLTPGFRCPPSMGLGLRPGEIK